MGRSRTPELVVEEVANVSMWGKPEWRTRKRGQLPGYGRPTAANLATFVEAGNASYREGGVNWHITEQARRSGSIPSDGYVEYLSARIVRQATGEVLATWEKAAA